MPDLARAMRDAAERQFVLRLDRELGPGYSQKLLPLLQVVRMVHEALSTERLGGGVHVCIALDDAAMPATGQSVIVDSSAQLLAQHDSTEPLTVLIAGNDPRMTVWRSAPEESSVHQCLVYRYLGPHRESFITGGKSIEVPIVPGYPSFFSMPYFRDLRDALLHHGSTCVRYSQCDIFASSWRDESHLIFRPKPEWRMRRSMQQHLRSTLRDHSGVTIMPEQNVDEAKRVDIKVTWMNSNRVALIEIKWLGASADVGATQFSRRFSKARGRDGAEQLVDYMDRYRAEAPHEEARGFLVIYDGRRARLTPTTTTLARADALAYEHAEIDYGAILDGRDDIEKPLRLFSFPRLAP